MFWMVCNCPSLAVSWRIYHLPGLREDGSRDGGVGRTEDHGDARRPAICAHAIVRVDGCGFPSSVTVVLSTRAEFVLLSVASAPTGELTTMTGGRLETSPLGISSMPLDKALSLRVVYWTVICPLLSVAEMNCWMFARFWALAAPLMMSKFVNTCVPLIETLKSRWLVVGQK